jgi:hypothetical protein
VHSVYVQYGTEYINHLSRVDLSWEVLLDGVWVKFASLEFKRPNALKSTEWAAALGGVGAVIDSGEHICRQATRHGYT